MGQHWYSASIRQFRKNNGAGAASVADFQDQLNNILSNPDAMSQIMQLAQSLSDNGDAPPPKEPPPPSTGDLFSSLSGGFDPAMIAKLLPVIQELSGQQDSNARQLLYALRPYLKQERQEKIERALQLAKLFRVGKTLLKNREG